MGLLDTNLGSLGAAGLSLAAYNEAKSGLEQYGRDVQAGTQAAMEQYMPRFEFKPFTVTTGTGATAGYQDGALTMGVAAGSPEEQLQKQMFQGAQNMYGGATQDVGQRAQDIYGSMMTAMSPEMERQRLANEQRALAQGQMGLSSNMYGGTDATTFGLNKAQQEAMNNAYLGARQAALGEQQQMANIGQSMFTQAYLPQAQQLQAFQAAQNAAQMQQSANQQYGTTGLQTYLTGLDAQLQAQLGRSNLAGDFMTGLASQMQPQVNPVTGKLIENTGLFGGLTLGDIYNKDDGWFGGLFGSSSPVTGSYDPSYYSIDYENMYG